MLQPDLLGYVLATAVALSGTTGARLNNTGEVSAASKVRPFPVLALTFLYGLSGLAAVLYFSWAHLSWQHLLSFFVIWLTLGAWVAKSSSRPMVWTVFVASVLVAGVVEVLLLLLG